MNLCSQAAGLTSQPSQTYASVTSQGVEASGQPPSGTHGSHMPPPTELLHDHQQRQLYTVEDEDDKPPSAHNVHS